MVFHPTIQPVYLRALSCLFRAASKYTNCAQKSSLTEAIKQMAQPGQFVQLHNEGDVMNKQPVSDNSFVVVNQQPSGREVFPYSLKPKGILVFSVFKCVVGSLLLIAEIWSVTVVKFNALIAFGICCGLTVSTHVLVRSRIVKPGFYIPYC